MEEGFKEGLMEAHRRKSQLDWQSVHPNQSPTPAQHRARGHILIGKRGNRLSLANFVRIVFLASACWQCVHWTIWTSCKSWAPPGMQSLQFLTQTAPKELTDPSVTRLVIQLCTESNPKQPKWMKMQKLSFACLFWCCPNQPFQAPIKWLHEWSLCCLSEISWL